MEPDLDKIWTEAQHVFLATISTVEIVESDSDADVQANFHVIETLKGNPESIPYLIGTTYGGGANCLFDFREGEKYLVVTDNSGRMSTCNGSVSFRDELFPDNGLYKEMSLEYFRAIASDQESACAFSRRAQIKELIKLRDLDREETGWRATQAILAEPEIRFEDGYGQRLEIRYGGCDDVKYELSLLGIRTDLSDDEIFEIVAAIFVGFEDMTVLTAFRNKIPSGSYEIEEIASGKLFTIEHRDLYIEIIYAPTKAALSVSYTRSN